MISGISGGSSVPIFNGQTVACTASNPVIDLASMFGIIKNEHGVAVPANKIFAKVLSDYYLSLDEIKSLEICQEALKDKNQFVDNGKLNMRLLIKNLSSTLPIYMAAKESSSLKKRAENISCCTSAL